MLRNNISDILGYASDAVEVAVPYFEKIGNYAGNTVKAANKRIMYAKKRAKRQMRIVKIKQWIELASNLVLLVAAVIALVMAIFHLTDYNDN